MRWHCTECGRYSDPQSLCYTTGKCFSCQDKVTYRIIIVIPDVFEGTFEQWEECFFRFKNNASYGEMIDSIFDFCEQMEWDVEIKHIKSNAKT